MAKPRVLVVGWDSADWRLLRPLMARGRMPVLRRLVETGASGNLAAIEPTLSPIVWTSLATGKLPHKHGVLGFVEPDASTGGIRSVGSGTRTARAFWEILSEAGLRTHVLGWFASHPAEEINGVCLSERFALPVSPDPAAWPVDPASVTPASAVDDFAPLRVHPRELLAEQVQPFLHGAAGLDQSSPAVAEKLTALARTLAEAATWQAAATHVLEQGDWDCVAVYFRALDELGHHFMPYHPPLLPGVDPAEAAFFAPVMETACAFHDLMLGRLLELAGPETTVILVSDHGFESGELRPGTVANETSTMAGWHRPFGIMAMRGPGVVAGERIHGSSVLDLTPTLLHLFGLPVGRDMDGKVWVTAFTAPQSVTWQDTWEKPGAPAGAASPVPTDAAAEAAALAQLAALGYLELPEAVQPGELAAKAATELRANRAAALLHAGLAAEALAEAASLAAEHPEDRRFTFGHVQCLIATGQIGPAAAALDSWEEARGSCVVSRRFRANILAAQGANDHAVNLLISTRQPNCPDPALHEQIGSILLRLRRWAQAEEAFRAALALDSDRPRSLSGLSMALARQQRDAEALDHALAAVELQHQFPSGHFQLGAVLAKTGQLPEAIRAFQTGLLMQPGHRVAHRWLARLCRRAGLGTQAALHERIEAQLALRAPE